MNVDGDYIRALRAKLGMNQTEMAELLGYGAGCQANIAKIEAGGSMSEKTRRLAALIAGDVTPRQLINQARNPARKRTLKEARASK